VSEDLKLSYTTIQHDKRQRLDISVLEYVMLDCIEKLSKPKFKAHKQTIANFLGMSRSGVIKAINRLCEKGLLYRIGDKELAVTDTWIKETIGGVYKVDSDVDKVDRGVYKVDTKCVQSRQPTKSKKEELELNSKNNKKDQPSLEDQFDQFWKLYPKKVGKGQAKKAFIKALKESDFESIMKGLNTSPRLKNAKQFIPHASTWLNGLGWEDEPEFEDCIEDRKTLLKQDIHHVWIELGGEKFCSTALLREFFDYWSYGEETMRSEGFSSFDIKDRLKARVAMVGKGRYNEGRNNA